MIYTTKIFQARENEEEDIRTIDSAVGSGSVAESMLSIDHVDLRLQMPRCDF